MKKKIAFGLIIVLVLISITGCTGCESWNRTKKDWDSSINGLNRVLKVYSNDGELINTYEGKFDIEINEYGNKVKFDLNGKRVIINNAIVIVEEE